MSQTYSSGDNLYTVVRKILENMTDVLSNLITIATNSGSTPSQTTSGFGTLEDCIAVSGSPTQLQDQACVRGVLLTASTGNTASCYVGGSNVSNSSDNRRGMELVPGGMTPVFIPCSNANQVYVISDGDDQHVGVIYL